MKKTTIVDYVIHSDEVLHALGNSLIGVKMLSKHENQIQIIKDLQVAYRRYNYGTFFKPKYKVVRILKEFSIDIVVFEKGKYDVREYILTPKQVKVWVERIIPDRIKAYNDLKMQLQLLKLWENTDK